MFFTRYPTRLRTSPLGMMDDLSRQLDRLFELAPRMALEPTSWSASTPRIDTREHEGGLLITAEVPGLAESDLTVTVEGDLLTIGGERRASVPDGYAARRQERAPFRFRHTLRLSSKLDPAAARAKLENGILELSIPKRPEAQPRQIPVVAS